MSIIEVKNLSKSYEYYRQKPGLLGTVKSFFARETLYAEAVKDISFSIGEGELVGFLGPNGAGKTTTLKMLSGILHSTNGEARVLGFKPTDRKKEFQKQFSLVMGQKNQLVADLPAMESFILSKEIYEVSDSDFKKTLSELIDVLNIGDILDIQVRKLSLGQRMKCELAAALLHNPKVLFLDEPTIGLDVIAQKNIRDFLKHYNKEKKTTIVLTSHYMEDIKDLCRRVIIINLGKVIYDGAIDDLIKKHAPYKLLKITFEANGIKKREVEKYGEVVDFSHYHSVIKVSRFDAKKVAIALLSSSLPVDDILIDEVEIDDVIRKVFSK